jgi:hypothetical protein
MRSYKIENWELSDSKLRTLSLASIEFKNLYAQIRNGNKYLSIIVTYNLKNSRLANILNDQPQPLVMGSNIIANEL